MSLTDSDVLSAQRHEAPSKPKSRRMPRAKREAQLLNVALELFIENGYQGTSMEDIAAAAGVTRPIVYNHFGSKDGIYLACLRRARASLDQHIVDAAKDPSSLEGRLHAGIEGYFTFVEENRASWHILFGGGAAIAGSASEEATRLRFQTVEKITQLLTAVVSGYDVDTREGFAHAVSGAGEQMAKWWMKRPHIPRQHVVELMLNFTWNGLRALKAD